MGTTLTGTTPQDTYDSLIKVTDNGPLSGTAKYLSDGLGNDSVLALSTARVGIGTTTPVSALTVVGTTTSGITIQSTVGASNGLKIFNDSTTDTASIFNYYSGSLILGTSNTERVRITSSGNVGIGTTNPAALRPDAAGSVDRSLEVSGNGSAGIRLTDSSAVNRFLDISVDDNIAEIGAYYSTTPTLNLNAYGSINFKRQNTTIATITAQGLTFNGDTAAANALDDYEEGTFTATITGGTFSSLNTGVYTKIGRMVYWYLNPTTTAITGNLQISGLPFTNADRSASIFATIPPSGVTYLPAFHNTSSASCDISVSGTYSGGAVSTYFAGVYSV